LPDKEKTIIALISIKLEDSLNLERERTGRNIIPMWKNLLYLLDKQIEGNFKGTISIKIDDEKVYSARLDNVDTCLGREYNDLIEGMSV